MAITMSSCTNIKAPVSQFNRYEINSIGLSTAALTFYFDIENPNDIPIGIRDINYSIALDGNHVVKGTDSGFNVQAREKKTVKFPVEISYSDLLGPAFNVARKFITRDGSIKYKIDGDLKVVDNVGFSSVVPISVDGNLNLY
jgi:LEA14-like dessication related protein